MQKLIIPTNDMWVRALRNLYERKEISLEQFAGCLRRIELSQFSENNER